MRILEKKNQPKHAPGYELLVCQWPAPTAFGTNFYDVNEISRFLSELSKVGRSSAKVQNSNFKKSCDKFLV